VKGGDEALPLWISGMAPAVPSRARNLSADRAAGLDPPRALVACRHHDVPASLTTVTVLLVARPAAEWQRKSQAKSPSRCPPFDPMSPRRAAVA